MWKLAAKGLKNVAAGKAQANLGLQSPHLPGAITRVGRFLYVTSIGWVSIVWYTGYVNMRTSPGDGPKLVLPGKKVIGSPDRPDKRPGFATSAPGGAASTGPGGNASAVAGSLPGGRKAAGFLPRNALYKPGRHDAGRDGQTSPGGPIIAPGGGRVLRILSDPNGFGPDYPVVRFTSGPYAGKNIYIGHTHAALHAGTTFTQDSIISFTGKQPVGSATVPGWFEIGFADASGIPGPIGQAAPF